MALQAVPTVVNHLLTQAHIAQESRIPDLTSENRATIDSYTNPEHEDCLAHQLQSICDRRDLKIRLAEDTIKGVMKGVVVGTVAGSAAWSATVLLNKISFVVAPIPSLIRSIFIGAAFGGIAGGVAASIKSVVTVTQTPAYLEWKQFAIRDKVLPLFKEFMQRADIYEDFICPVSKDIIRVPARGLDGRIYEWSAISNWLEQKEREFPPERLAQMTPQARENAKATFSPIRGQFFTRANLKFDAEYHERLFGRIRVIFNQVVDTQVREGLLAYQDDVLNTRAQITKHLISEVSALYATDQIRKSEFEQCIEQVKRMMHLQPL